MFTFLNISNGEMSPTFTNDIKTYNVKISNDVTSLSLSYGLSESSSLNIVGNSNFKEGDNYVFLELKNNDILTTYTLIVTKPEVKETMGEFNKTTSLETSSRNTISFDPVPSLIIIFVLLFLITLKLFYFPRRKKKSLIVKFSTKKIQNTL
jgi:hypothetical protein